MLVTSNVDIFLGYASKVGVRLRPGVQVFIEDHVYTHPDFQRLKNEGKLVVDDFDDDHTSWLCVPEVQEMIDDAVSGGGEVELYRVEFDYTTPNLKSLRVYNSPKSIRSVVVSVDIPFDGGRTMTLGFPGAQDEIATTQDIDLSVACSYQFDPVKVFYSQQTFTAYFSGTSTQGMGNIFFM